MFKVVLQLAVGGEAEVGVFDDRDGAVVRAQELLTAAEGGQWLEVGNRYVRPEAIISIDLRETDAPSWKGSASRQHWAGGE